MHTTHALIKTHISFDVAIRIVLMTLNDRRKKPCPINPRSIRMQFVFLKNFEQLTFIRSLPW